MVREAVESLGGEATRKEIKEYIGMHYKNVKEGTINQMIIRSAVNIPSRINHPVNQQTRKCDSKYDVLFSGPDGKLSMYNPLIHGKWEIIKNKNNEYVIKSEEYECFLPVDEHEIEICQNAMTATLKKIKSKFQHTIVDWHGTQEKLPIWWFGKYGFWWGTGYKDKVWWNGFGVADQADEFNPKKISVICDINISARVGGDSQGLFVKDDAGRYYIAHTGRFTLRGAKSILDDYVSWKKLSVCGKGKEFVFVISALDDPKLAQNLNQFIRAIHKARNRFAFVKKDFDSLSGNREDARYIRDRFKVLQCILEDRLSQGSDTYDSYTGMPNNRPNRSGKVSWRDYMWLGIVADYALTDSERESIQFQVKTEGPTLDCMIWISRNAQARMNFMKDVISKHIDIFVRMLNELPAGYTISAKQEETEHSFSTSKVSAADISKIVDALSAQKLNFFLGVSWNRTDVIARSAKIVDDIVDVFETLMPTYKFLNDMFEPPTDTYMIDDIIREGCFLDKSKLEGMLKTLEKKKNLIIQGSPGTGKTWLAKKLGFALMGFKSKTEMRVLQFHPNLSYEDFVRGWRPSSAPTSSSSNSGRLELVDGPFLKTILDAVDNPGRKFVIIIEEINRGNPANIFGEMLTLLEADKRKPEEALMLSYSHDDDKPVYIPDNIYVIGTMNVADRSIAMVDLALRRRFGFSNLEPMFNERWEAWTTECGIHKDVLKIIRTNLKSLNDAISSDPLLGPHFRIGHSYVTPSDKNSEIEDSKEWFRDIVKNEIGPLLDEYWINDTKRAHDETEKLLKDLGD